MADEIVVKGASVSLQPANPAVSIVTATHTLSLDSTGPFVKSESNEVFLEADVDSSFATYTTAYSTPDLPTPGLLMYQSLASMSDLSELTNKDGDPIVLKSSQGTITCSVSAPASLVTPSSTTLDANPSYDIDFSFTDAAQTLAKSD